MPLGGLSWKPEKAETGSTYEKRKLDLPMPCTEPALASRPRAPALDRTGANYPQPTGEGCSSDTFSGRKRATPAVLQLSTPDLPSLSPCCKVELEILRWQRSHRETVRVVGVVHE